jgi:hypothetical protein
MPAGTTDRAASVIDDQDSPRVKTPEVICSRAIELTVTVGIPFGAQENRGLTNRRIRAGRMPVPLFPGRCAPHRRC